MSAFEVEGDNPVFEVESGEEEWADMDTTVPSKRRRLFILLDEPDSSWPAAIIGAVIMIMIVLGTITFCLETTYCVGFTPLADEPHLGCPAEEIKILNDMKLFETVCIVAFTIEYLTKVVCCSERLSPNPSVIRYLCKTMSLIDLAAILPFYIELFFGGDIGLSVLRMLRMTRIFRVLKVGSFANDLMIFVEGMRRAREGLILLLFLTGLYLCVFAAVLYALEYESQQECRKCSDDGYGCSCPSKLGFTSIPTTWYFIIASMTTVGYGDHYPITTGGKIATGFCMIAGIMVLALPFTVIGVSFDGAFRDALRLKDKQARYRADKRSKSSGADIKRVELPQVATVPVEHVLLLKQAAEILYEQFIIYGDPRFQTARQVLIEEGKDELAVKTFLPAMPKLARSSPRASFTSTKSTVRDENSVSRLSVDPN